MKQNKVYNALVKYLSPRQSANGWKKFNAVCCVHNGESRPDTRQRGGIKNDGGRVGYHCFNCGYKAVYAPGFKLSNKMKNVLEWSGMPEAELKRLEFDVWILKESIPNTEINFKRKVSFDFKETKLPNDSMKFKDLIFSDNPPEEFLDVLAYASTRFYGNILNYDLYWSPISNQKGIATKDINKRIIIPFKWEGKIVGWTGRLIVPSKTTKYFNVEQNGYIFNTESISETDEYIFVCEGPLDALSIDGVATLGDRCSKQMADWLNAQKKKIIVVPDREKHGGNLVDIAIENGWMVTFPDWESNIKDANDAVLKYGKLFTVQSIIQYATDNKLKINVERKIKIK